MSVKKYALAGLCSAAASLLLTGAAWAGSNHDFDGWDKYKKNYNQRQHNHHQKLAEHFNKKLKGYKKRHDIEWVTPEFADVTVHDPSVMKVDDTYYVFGSHLAAAKSDDLVQWQQISEGVSNENPLINDVFNELSETFAWAETNTLWAADVIQLDDGKFYMYYNACRGDSPRSAMGVAVADSPEGPYTNKGVFLRSGMWGLPSEDGTIYDATIHPNVVDPDTFFDADGKLWMIYGSYSGGIFIMEMDPETGFPLPGQGYGKHLMGGNHSRIEGAYVLYSPETRYYYMFVSFGGLDAVGGYNIRVSRSLNPDGPYFDSEGNDMALVKSDPALPLFDDATIEPFGVKLMGSHLFDRKLGEDGEGIGTGYVSPGHNSAYYDEDSGRYFLMFHSRFPERGEFHQVRVHEMFVNDDDWLVVAPYRYAPREVESNKRFSRLFNYCSRRFGCVADQISYLQVPGDYKFINHGKAISPEVLVSNPISLEVNGRIKGSVEGRWYYRGRNAIELKIDGVKYEGVLSRQWNETAEDFVVTFSALSDAGIAVWGSRLDDKDTRQVLEDILADIALGNTDDGITHDLDLPLIATRGATISWSSSDPAIIAADGTVNRPEHGAGNALVTMKAKATYNGRSKSAEFDIIVREQAPDGLLAHYAFDSDLLDSTGQFAGGYVSGDRIDLPGGNISYGGGISGDAAVFDGVSGVRLPNGIITGNTYSVSFWLNPSVLTPFTTTFFGARDPNSWISFLPMGHGWVGGATMLWSGAAWYDAGLGMNIPANAWSHIAFTVNEGTVAVYVNGELRFSGVNFPNVFIHANGVFSLGVNWWDIPYQGMMDELYIYEKVLTPEEVLEFANP